MATAATISIQLEAQTATLKKGFDEAKGAIGQLDSNMAGSVAKGMAMFNVGLAAVKGALAAVQGAIASVSQAMQEMDEAAKFAQRLGTTADALMVLGFAAEQSGASQDVLNMALEKMNNSISDATQGVGTGKKALDELGLSLDALNGMSADQQFAAIADAMQGVDNAADRTRLTMDLFGRSGGALLPLLMGGSAALNAFGEEADNMGLLLGDSRASVEEAGDAINKMKRAWGAFVQQIAVAVAPALIAIANGLSTIVGWFNKLVGSATGASASFTKFADSAGKGSGTESVAVAAVSDIEKEAEASRKALEDRGKTLAASMRTPVEIYRDTVADLNELVNAGTISWEIYNRGVKKAVQTLTTANKAVDDFKTPGIGVVTRNSAEGFSAVNAAKRERDDAERRHRESLTASAKIESAIRESGLILAPVTL